MKGQIIFQEQNGTQKKTVSCYRKLNLLGHAQIEKLHIGSECGGHGICGRDRILIPAEYQSRLNPITDEERSHIPTKDLEKGWRLGCQAFPANDDLEIKVICPVFKP